MDKLFKFLSLFKDKRLEIKPNVYLEIAEEVNIKAYLEKDIVYIKFGTPYPYLDIDKLGPIDLKNTIRPRVNSLEIKEDLITLRLDRFMDFSVDPKEIFHE